jgi:iron complex transport system ATP-binding protein
MSALRRLDAFRWRAVQGRRAPPGERAAKTGSGATIARSTGSDPIMEARGISIAYPGRGNVLRGLSLAVGAGTVTAVLGPNGSGKTTLLDVCLGWRKPDGGMVLLRGKPLPSWSRREQAQAMSLVPQRENVRFDFSVTDYVLLGRAPHLPSLGVPGPEDFAIVRDALRTAGIAGLADRSITTLSGGEYQLMLIARSLAQQAALLLLDEPASQLDPAHRQRVTGLLRRLADRGLAVVYTSHDPQATAAAADTVHLLHGGRFAFSGTPRRTLTPEALQAVYGLPFRVAWTRRGPHISWDG